MITIGAMAKYYGVLPSVVASQASTFDLMIYDVSMTWEKEQQERSEGKSTVPELNQEELLKILKESRGE